MCRHFSTTTSDILILEIILVFCVIIPNILLKDDVRIKVQAREYIFICFISRGRLGLFVTLQEKCKSKMLSVGGGLIGISCSTGCCLFPTHPQQLGALNPFSRSKFISTPSTLKHTHTLKKKKTEIYRNNKNEKNILRKRRWVYGMKISSNMTNNDLNLSA